MDEHKKIRADLSNIKKGNPFAVPERYFEDFSARLSDNIHTRRQPSFPVRLVLTWKPYFMAATIIIAALLAGKYIFNDTRIRKADRIFHAEVSRVVEQELYSISEETILEVLEVDMPETPSGSVVTSEDAIEYLINEDLNEEELINAL